LTTAFFVNLSAFAVACVASLLLIIYEKSLKNLGLSGNLAISSLVALVFVFGALSVNPSLEHLKIISVLALLAFLATLARELVKDVQDLKGDALVRKTLPAKIGISKVNFFSSILLAVAIALSPLPYLLHLKNIYLWIVLLANAIFIYSIIAILRKTPKKASNSIKLGMLVALVAFIVNAVI
jgi:geranylgeranylglycerol-phosphate geranylgeranyltransferase